MFAIKLFLTLCILLSNGSRRNVSFDFVDMIELNTCYQYDTIKDANTKDRQLTTKPLYTQLIIYNWNPQYCRYDIASWMILNDSEGPRYEYHVIKNDNIYSLTIYNVHKDIKRSPQTLIFRSKMFSYTDTMVDNDPERWQQKLLPQHERLENLLLMYRYDEYTVEQR